jgi:metal-responsive CopG/Arc/MetJ family transcriptional regulator
MNITFNVFIFKVAAIATVATTSKVTPIGIGLTTELLELIDAQRDDISRSLFVRRIIQEYCRYIEQEKKSTTRGIIRFVSISQKPATKVVRNQTMSKVKK